MGVPLYNPKKQRTKINTKKTHKKQNQKSLGEKKRLSQYKGERFPPYEPLSFSLLQLPPCPSPLNGSIRGLNNRTGDPLHILFLSFDSLFLPLALDGRGLRWGAPSTPPIGGKRPPITPKNYKHKNYWERKDYWGRKNLPQWIPDKSARERRRRWIPS